MDHETRVRNRLAERDIMGVYARCNALSNKVARFAMLSLVSTAVSLFALLLAIWALVR